MFISRDFKFDAAHKLERYHGKCESLHGHTYKLRVTLRGEPNEEGMIIDFLELKDVVKSEILDQLDHSYLNEIIDQPTAENIARWIWNKLKIKFMNERYTLYEITVWESEDTFVTYRGE
ncbi:MAG TPA: 6-carboxytetrahydropterin synthase QueD [Pseudothermotoga sp.]